MIAFSQLQTEDPGAHAKPEGPRADEARVRRVVDTYYDFVWRSLRRLGVASSGVEDAAQQVFCVFAQRTSDVPEEKERSFLFGTAMRIARTARRGAGRRAEVSDDDALLAIPASARGRPDALLEDQRARDTLDTILEGMPQEQLAVFVLHEIEELTMAEIAAMLEVPSGTVASRLRRAREHFAQACKQVQDGTEGSHEE